MLVRVSDGVLPMVLLPINESMYWSSQTASSKWDITLIPVAHIPVICSGVTSSREFLVA